MIVGDLNSVSLWSNIISEEDEARLKMGRITHEEEVEVRAILRGNKYTGSLKNIFYDKTPAQVGRPIVNPTIPYSKPRKVANRDGRIPLGFLLTKIKKEVHQTRQEGRSAGKGRLFSDYIRRTDAVELDSEGNPIYFDGTAGYGSKVWDLVEDYESRVGNNVQTRLIIELPYEEKIGSDARQILLQSICHYFDSNGLLYEAVVHKPEAGNDPRNYHAHIIFHDRSFYDFGPEYELDFELHKFFHGKDRAGMRGFVKEFREHCCLYTNIVYEGFGLSKRVDAGSYKDLGVSKEPGKHLGQKRSRMEAKGYSTETGHQNAIREIQYNMETVEAEALAFHESHKSFVEIKELYLNQLEGVVLPSPCTRAANKFKQDLQDINKCSKRFVDSHLAMTLKDWGRERVPSRLLQLKGQVEQSAPGKDAADYGVALAAFQTRLDMEFQQKKKENEGAVIAYQQAQQTLGVGWTTLKREMLLHNFEKSKRALKQKHLTQARRDMARCDHDRFKQQITEDGVALTLAQKRGLIKSQKRDKGLER